MTNPVSDEERTHSDDSIQISSGRVGSSTNTTLDSQNKTVPSFPFFKALIIHFVTCDYMLHIYIVCMRVNVLTTLYYTVLDSSSSSQFI